MLKTTCGLWWAGPFNMRRRVFMEEIVAKETSFFALETLSTNSLDKDHFKWCCQGKLIEYVAKVAI